MIIRHWGTAEGLPQNSVRAIAQTGDGYLWLGTYGGLVRYDGLSFSTLDSGDYAPLAAARVTTLHHDELRGGLWVGTTNQGIARISGQQVDWHRRDTASYDGEIWDVQSTPDGTVWTAGSDVRPL